MGKPRTIKSVADMEALWAAYKDDCDNRTVLTHEFSQKLGQFVSQELNKPCSYTLEGFCVYIGMHRSSFYATYVDDPDYRGLVSHRREECELDVRQKFEGGQIPSQLSGLWMSRHGYGTIKAETEASNLVDEWVAGVMNDGDES